jgi:AbrB family looped-hinge helix DNA binding protein
MVSEEARLSSKGQIVLPKYVRERLGLKKGDKLRVQLDEKAKVIIIRPRVEPHKEIFVRAGTRLTTPMLKESDDLDEGKIRRLLKAIGAKDSPGSA